MMRPHAHRLALPTPISARREVRPGIFSQRESDLDTGAGLAGFDGQATTERGRAFFERRGTEAESDELVMIVPAPETEASSVVRGHDRGVSAVHANLHPTGSRLSVLARVHQCLVDDHA